MWTYSSYVDNTALAAPHCVPTSFLSSAKLRLAFVSALLMCGLLSVDGYAKIRCTICELEFYVSQHDFNSIYFGRQCK